MPEWTIARLDLARDLDEVVALEALCFTNPTTREMFHREAATSDVAHAYVMRLAADLSTDLSTDLRADLAADLTADGAADDPTTSPGRLLAYCSVWLIFDELHINTVAVHPDWRQQGLASTLLRHVLADAARHGADKATLEVRRSNEAARRLYARFGFTQGGVRPAYYRQPVEDALILWRTGLQPAAESDDNAPPQPTNGLA